MRDMLKRIKADVILSGIFSVALGIVLFVWSVETINIICRILAAGLVLIGILNIIMYVRNRQAHP